MNRTALLLWLVGVAGSCLAARPQASIELLPRPSVSGGTVLLGDVAKLEANDLGLMRKLVRLPIGRAPGLGEVALLRREALAGWVQRQTALPEGVLGWSGAEESRVRRVAPKVGGDVIARAAVDAARSRLQAMRQDADVQVRMEPRDLDLPPGTVRFEVRGLEAGPLRRYLVLWVDVWADRSFVRTVPVALEVDLREEARSPSSGPDALPLQEDAFIAAAHELPEGPPAVLRGDWATLRSEQGPIVLESRVEVLQDGRPGQRIRVRALGDSGLTFARVVGRGRLELAP